MEPTGKINMRKVLIDVCCVAIVGIAVLMFFLFGKPYERGFFCNDESLYHMFKTSTVTSPMLYAVGIFLPICTMVAGEYFYWKRSGAQSSFMMLGKVVPYWVAMVYNKIGLFGYGAATTALATDIAKYTIGRLRPHFMDVCKPNINCSLPENQHSYITNFTCTATNVSPRLLKELRLSFPSGHSSFSAYTMVWLALYLQLRITWKGSKLLKHFLQFVCLMMAWFTAMTRISNYKHHWSDVLAGMSLGTLIALIMVFCVADLFKERRVASGIETKLRSAEYDAENGTQRRNIEMTNGHELNQMSDKYTRVDLTK
ncbi:putative phosphatidate phosphatase isoform X2 [Venturia canescens]|uniref:putative phosphatidate phosphatase isoform X2 n=1 Tax=Venturia canescens TaxID=32260 RepID=UPI001C9C9F1F|nr:putative phosphatidate phosphatase isoform X2 [Venturia canescens]